MEHYTEQDFEHNYNEAEEPENNLYQGFDSVTGKVRTVEAKNKKFAFYKMMLKDYNVKIEDIELI